MISSSKILFFKGVRRGLQRVRELSHIPHSFDVVAVSGVESSQGEEDHKKLVHFSCQDYSAKFYF